MGITNPSGLEETDKSRYSQWLLVVGEGLLFGAILFGAFWFVFRTSGGEWSTGERLLLILLGMLLVGIGRSGFLVASLTDSSSEQKQTTIRRWRRAGIGAILIAGGLMVVESLVVRSVMLFFGPLAVGIGLTVLGLWASPTFGRPTGAREK